MSDFYREVLISKERTGKDNLVKFALIGVSGVLVAATIVLSPVLFLPAVIVCGISWFLLKRQNVEYEYSYVNGDFDIDRIFNKEKRKKAASLNLEDLVLAARSGSHDLDSELKGCVEEDYTSGKENVPSWTLVYSADKQKKAVKLELDSEIIDDMWRKAPRKVLKNS